MKQVSPELSTYLNTRKAFYMCDLYEIQLLSGLVFRYANYDMPVTMLDGRYFSHKGPIFKRDRIKLSSQITVDKMNVTMYVEQADTIGGTPVIQVAHNGGFDGATLALHRCFMDAPGKVVGVLEHLFSGEIDIADGGGLELNLEVKSGVQRLNVEWPVRKYYPSCPFSLYSTACGLKLDNYISYGTVTAAGSHTQFTSDLTFPSGYFDSGGIEFTAGALTGVTAPVKYSSSGSLTLLLPLESSPKPGDRFKVYPGCDKTPAVCREKFNNFNRNRATPYIPLKEMIM